jgi:hypothetical protein
MTDDEIIAAEKIAYLEFSQGEKQPEDYRKYCARLDILALELQDMPNLKSAWQKRARVYRDIAVKVNMIPRYKYE